MCQSVLVIGLGQAGRSIFELFGESGKFSVLGCDVDAEKMRRIGKYRLRLRGSEKELKG